MAGATRLGRLERESERTCDLDPKWIESDHLAAEALGIMEERKITAVLVRAEDGSLRGVIHLHDLWGLQMV